MDNRPSLIIRTIVIVGTLAAVGLVYAQFPVTNPDQGGAIAVRDSADMRDVALVRALYAEMNSPAEGSECTLAYSVTTAKQRYGIVDTLHTDVEFVGSMKRTYLKSDQFVMLRDTVVTAVILRERRTIVLTRVPTEESRDRHSNTMMVVRDTLFDGATVAQRSTYPMSDGRVEEMVTLKLNDMVAAPYGIERLQIRFDRAARRLVSIRADFSTDETPFVVVAYGERTCIPDGLAFDTPVLHGIVDDNGRAVGQYKDYAVLDRRELGEFQDR